MPMFSINFKRSLIWRLLLTFSLILLVVAIAYIVITAIATNKYYQETTQQLNAEVAAYLIEEAPPFKDGSVNKASLDMIMHSMMAVNPGIEVYLLDTTGKILSFVVLDKKVKLSRIDTHPIEQFLAQKGQKYILGDDPRHPGEKTIFSASKVFEKQKFLGYVYIVLASEKYENVHAAISGSYWLRVGTNAFVVTLLSAFFVGILLIWMLTRNLRVIVQTVNQFKDGNLHARIPESAARGELATLARTFNSMSDTILRNIDELKQVDQLRRELIANVSHDLRNPLAIIQGYIETLLIKDEAISGDERKAYLKIILESSEKLTRLVVDLFELSKLETGQVQLKKEPFFMGELLNDTCSKFALLSKQKNIDIHTEIPEAIPQVYADLSMIDRVVQNLLDNALKFTPENGKIEISAQTQNGNVEVSVENTGKGIPQKDLPHIFDRYYKVDKEKSGIAGSGLGLAIVKKMLEAHQAEIQVSSIEGKTTRFMFSLPVHSA